MEQKVTIEDLCRLIYPKTELVVVDSEDEIIVYRAVGVVNDDFKNRFYDKEILALEPKEEEIWVWI